MKIVLAPDSFKGSISAFDFIDVAYDECMKYGYEVVKAPLSDGGEGSLDILYSILGGEIKFYETYDAFMDRISVPVLFVGDSVYIESAKVIGLNLYKKDVLNATTYGLGLLLKQLIDDCNTVNVFLGGSATNDAGKGMMEALDGVDYKKINFNVMCDVTNPLYGENGATKVFSRQKGASEEDAFILEERIKAFSKGKEEYVNLNGAGASGGLGFAFMAFMNAKYYSGIDYFMKLYDFEKMKPDLVITGEGKYDAQSYNGKVISGLRKSKARVIVFCGKNETNDNDVYALNSSLDKKDTLDKLAFAIRNFLLENRGV